MSRIYGIPSVNDHPTALASALTYWVFRCRDRSRSPAMGIKTWEYLQSSIKNAAIPARDVDSYLQNLCSRLVVAHLRPAELTWILQPEQVILRVTRNPDGTLGNIQERESDQPLVFKGWQDILEELKPQGVTERHVLKLCREKPHIVTTYCRVRFEEDRAVGKDAPVEAEAIEVEAVNAS